MTFKKSNDDCARRLCLKVLSWQLEAFSKPQPLKAAVKRVVHATRNADAPRQSRANMHRESAMPANILLTSIMKGLKEMPWSEVSLAMAACSLNVTAAWKTGV